MNNVYLAQASEYYCEHYMPSPICVCDNLQDAEKETAAYNKSISIDNLKSKMHMPYEMFDDMKINDDYREDDKKTLTKYVQAHPEYLTDELYGEDLELYDAIKNGQYNDAEIVSIPFVTKARVAFISGHRDVTDEEFKEHYAPLLDKAIDRGDNFVVGDYYGVDIMAQEYLASKSVAKERVTVCHMFTAPRNIADAYAECVHGGFQDDIDRDSYMTWHSDYDIAWIREGKASSGTAQNVIRRYGTTGIPNI